MQIKTYPIGSYQTNCYMVWEEGSDSCILIDPGYVPEQLLEEVRRNRKTLEAIRTKLLNIRDVIGSRRGQN